MGMKKINVSIPTVRELYDSLPDDVKKYDWKMPIGRTVVTVSAAFDTVNRVYLKDVEVVVPAPPTIWRLLHGIYADVVSIMLREANRDDVQEPSIVLAVFTTYDKQSVANWGVTDRALGERGERSIVYNGGILFDRTDFELWKSGEDVRLFSIHT